MIFDNIKNLTAYSEMDRLNMVLTYIAGLHPENFPDETVLLDAHNVFVNPVAFVTKEEKDCLYEAHKQYADIHYIAEGCEKIIVTDIDKTTVVTPHDDLKDIGFYQCDQGTVCILNPGDFLVCFPHDAHKVAIAVDNPSAVKKIVGKIKI